jgi:hypothetical protein
MRRSELLALLGLAIAAGVPPRAATAQDTHVVGYSVTTSSREASAGFDLADGSALRIALRNGQVLVNGAAAGRYQAGGALERQWREALSHSASLTTDQAVALLRGWTAEGVSGEDVPALAAITRQLSGLRAGEVVPVPPTPPTPATPDVEAAVAAANEAAASANERAQVIAERVRDAVSRIRVDPRIQVREFPPDRGIRSRAVAPFAGASAAMFGLFGTFVALCAMAFGVSFFAGRQIDVIADTVHTSLARSFFVGLLAQPLILPAFVAMIAALAVTVVGLLVIPVAIVAFAAALIAAVIGGYLAVARVAGSAWMFRRHGDHGTEGFGILRSVATGLGIVLAIWVPAAVFGWVPVAGPVLTWTAAVTTWAFATTGFGAALLTRGGVRTTFGRRFAPPILPPATLFEEPGPEISTAEWLGGRKQ